MLKQITIGLLLTGYLAAETFVVAAQTGPPQRKVEGNTITSTIDPAAKIQLLNSPVYVGADRWILYGPRNVRNSVAASLIQLRINNLLGVTNYGEIGVVRNHYDLSMVFRVLDRGHQHRRDGLVIKVLFWLIDY